MSDYYQDGFIDGPGPYYQQGRGIGNGGRGGSSQGNCRRCGSNSQSMPGNRPGGGPPPFGPPPFGQSASRPPQRPQPPRPPQQAPRPSGPPPQYGPGPQMGWNQTSNGCNCRGRRRDDLWGQEVSGCNVSNGSNAQEEEIGEIPLQPWMWLDSDMGEQYWLPGDYFYPCSSGQSWEDRQNQIDKDLQYFMGMYPAQIQQLVMPVRETVDSRDYEGSFIYDEYPDQNQIDQMVDEVIDNMDPAQIPDGNESEQPCPLDPIVKLLIIQEILIRRNR